MAYTTSSDGTVMNHHYVVSDDIITMAYTVVSDDIITMASLCFIKRNVEMMSWGMGIKPALVWEEGWLHTTYVDSRARETYNVLYT